MIGNLHYHCREYALAEQFLARAAAAGTFEGVDIVRGLIARRVGRWDDALTHFRSAQDFDPLGTYPLYEEAVTLLYARRCDEARATLERVLAQSPAHHAARAALLWARLTMPGTSTAAARALEELAVATTDGWNLFLLALQVDRLDLVHAWFDRHPDADRGQLEGRPVSLVRAMLDDLAGGAASARGRYEHALDELRRDGEADGLFEATALAGLGRVEEAVAAARAALAAMPAERDTLEHANRLQGLVTVLATAGHAEDALVEMRRALAQPGWWSLEHFRRDPRFASVRALPAFGDLSAGERGR